MMKIVTAVFGNFKCRIQLFISCTLYITTVYFFFVLSQRVDTYS